MSDEPEKREILVLGEAVPLGEDRQELSVFVARGPALVLDEYGAPEGLIKMAKPICSQFMNKADPSHPAPSANLAVNASWRGAVIFLGLKPA